MDFSVVLIEMTIEVVEIICDVNSEWWWIFWPIVIILTSNDAERTETRKEKRSLSDGIEQLTENHYFPLFEKSRGGFPPRQNHHDHHYFRVIFAFVSTTAIVLAVENGICFLRTADFSVCG